MGERVDELEMGMTAAVIAAEVDEQPDFSTQIEALDARIRELENAVADMRTVKASAAAGTGRKTVAVLAQAKQEDRGGVLDASLESLSVEQRILVKNGLMRAGLL